MKMNLLKSAIFMMFATVALFSCTESSMEQELPTPETPSTLKAASAWSRVFTDNFTNTGSWNNWARTQRLDYNSKLCSYLSSNPQIATYDSRTCLVLSAVKNGNVWNSGHVKSNFSFKPSNNTEYRTSAYIKLVALNGSSYTGFASTYGVWPTFWTVQESNWPVNGEMDIMEGYSFGGTTKFASNLFYGTAANNNLLGTTCEKAYTVTEGWHLYEQYWKNENGTISITIKVDEIEVASYSNASNPNLKLQNFGPHNIILNLNVGCTTWNAFNNNSINVFTKTMMWVDYVTVNKRTLK